METQAILYVQNLIRDRKVVVVSSYILWYEIGQNPHLFARYAIEKFLQENTSEFVGENQKDEMEKLAKEIMESGVKAMDALHVAAPINFITETEGLL